MHDASDRSTIFLTVLARRTVKKLLSPIGPGFESRRRQQKGHRSMICYQNVDYQLIYRTRVKIKDALE